MPFTSQAQARYMFAKHPKVAKEFARKTPSISALPQHVKHKMTTKQIDNMEHKIHRKMGIHCKSCGIINKK